MAEKELNHLFGLAAGFVNGTSQHLFLSGKAGTGKTTFLKYIRENSFKKMAVVAPTGVAAVNAGGVTMHSFFQLPRGTYLPTKERTASFGQGEVMNEPALLRSLRFSSSKRELLRELELLVIDEVSMLRADMLDATDAILRHVRRLPHMPFGGVQMLYIGDLFQLPPVAVRGEWNVLKEHYKSPFFFDAQVVQEVPPLYIELKKIYRQSDETFIRILNNIRNNEASEDDLEQLHQRYDPSFQPAREENFITLTTHNSKAETINRNELEKLPGRWHYFEGTVKDEFYENAYPVEKTIALKVGAQVMLIKNDKGEVRRYYNGKIGVVGRITGEKIFVQFPNEEGELELEKETWKNIRYLYNKEKDSIDEEELGSYTQYPVRLAWAITIHKSQGLTFNKAIVDAGESFAAGQVYVALSRLTSMGGLVLYSKIHSSAVHTDERVLHFAGSEKSEEELWEVLKEEQKKFVGQSLIETFSWQKLVDTLQQHAEDYEYRQFPGVLKATAWAKSLVEKAAEQRAVAQKFAVQLERLLTTAAEDNYAHLHQRTEAAAVYFSKAVDELIDYIQQHADEQKEKARTKKYIKDLATLQQVLKRKKLQMQHAARITAGLAKGLDAQSLLQIVQEQRKTAEAVPAETPKKESNKLPKGGTRLLTLQLFRQGKTPDEIATERNLSAITVENHLAACVESGEIAVTELVPINKMTVILKAIEETDGTALAPIKEKLSSDYSYGEIKAVMAYRQMMTQQEPAE